MMHLGVDHKKSVRNLYALTFVTTTMRSRPRFLASVSSGSGNSSSSTSPLIRSEKLWSILRDILLVGDPVSDSSPGSTYDCHRRMS